MSIGYRVMYAVGLTPWDNGQVPPELLALVEGPEGRPAGRALDLGCGTGAQAVDLAQRGWQVTAIDNQPKALRAARRRAQESAVDVDWVRGDVGALRRSGLTGPYDLLYDLGCFHGLSAQARDAYARDTTALAAEDARLLMFGFSPGRRGPAPSGVNAAELTERFPDWDLVEHHPAHDVELAGPLRNAAPYWYLLRR